jgi:DnaJ-class molecular chaperone
MEDQLEEAQRKMREATDTMMSDWLNQMWETMRNDPVIGALWSTIHTGGDSAPRSGLDPYWVIDLEKSATDEQVKKRYRELAMKLHTDTAGIEGTESLFKLVTAAYQQISRERGC